MIGTSTAIPLRSTSDGEVGLWINQICGWMMIVQTLITMSAKIQCWLVILTTINGWISSDQASDGLSHIERCTLGSATWEEVKRFQEISEGPKGNKREFKQIMKMTQERAHNKNILGCVRTSPDDIPCASLPSFDLFSFLFLILCIIIL